MRTAATPNSVTIGGWAALEPLRLPTVLAAFHGHWGAAGGVAIELLCDHRIRDHLDIDVEILRGDAAHRGRLTAWTPRLPLAGHQPLGRPRPRHPWTARFLLAATTSPINGARRWAYR